MKNISVHLSCAAPSKVADFSHSDLSLGFLCFTDAENLIFSEAASVRSVKTRLVTSTAGLVIEAQSPPPCLTCSKPPVTLNSVGSLGEGTLRESLVPGF